MKNLNEFDTCIKFIYEFNKEIIAFLDKKVAQLAFACSKLTIKTPERRYWCRSGVFLVNFEHTSHPVLVFLLLTLSR